MKYLDLDERECYCLMQSLTKSIMEKQGDEPSMGEMLSVWDQPDGNLLWRMKNFWSQHQSKKDMKMRVDFTNHLAWDNLDTLLPIAVPTATMGCTQDEYGHVWYDVNPMRSVCMMLTHKLEQLRSK